MTRRLLATSQVAIALVLLLGAGLLLASFRAVMRTDLGFDPAGVITGAVTLPGARFPDDASQATFVDRLLPAVRAVAGVEAAGVTAVLPLSGDYNDSVILPEGYVATPGESLISPANSSVSPGYFEAMRVQLLKGRLFDDRDVAASPHVAVIDQELASRFWPGQDPIGRRMRRPASPQDLVTPGPNTQWITVVGVVNNVQIAGIASGNRPVGAYYFPISQQPDGGLMLVVRSSIGAEAMVPSLRAALKSIDAELPLYNVRTMEERVEAALVSRRVPMLMAMGFAGVALALAGIGLYGVLTYMVVQRRREIGIRMALGSTAREVFSLVLADGGRILVAGMVLGLIGAWFVGRAMTSVLYGVQPFDPVVIAVVVGALGALGLLAVMIPARRAARVNPVSVLG